MKKLSETYKEQGIDFDFPITIKNPEGRETYYEDGNGFWRKSEYDTNGNWTYYKDSVGDWWKSRFDADSNETYYEDHTDYWRKGEYDAKGNKTYYESSDLFWRRVEYDSEGNETYFENSYGDKKGTPRSQTFDGKVIEMDGKKYKLTEL